MPVPVEAQPGLTVGGLDSAAQVKVGVTGTSSAGPHISRPVHIVMNSQLPSLRHVITSILYDDLRVVQAGSWDQSSHLTLTCTLSSQASPLGVSF